MKYLYFIVCISTVIFGVADLDAAITRHYSDTGLGAMSTGSAESWGISNITARDTTFEFTFDYTTSLHNLTNSTAGSGAPTTPVVMWEAGGTGTGACLVLDGANLIFFAGDDSADYISFAHGLTAGQNDVQVLSSLTFNTSATDDTLELYVNGSSIGSSILDVGTDWAGTNTSAIGQVGVNALFEDGTSAPFDKDDYVDFNDGGSNDVSFAAYDGSSELFSINALSGTTAVFNSGFQYTSEPTPAAIGTDAANLNGAIGQVGTFSGTIPAGENGDYAPDLIGFKNNLLEDGTGRIMMVDRAAGNGSFRANLSDDINIDGAFVSLELATRRTQNNNNKDYDIVGFDKDGNESFHLRVITNSTDPSERLAVVTNSGSTLTTDLPTTSGADANDDLINVGNGDPLAEEIATILLTLSDTGYIIEFLRPTGTPRAYTTSEISYNGSATELSYIEFQFQGDPSPADPALQSGFFVDNISVRGTLVPEPATLAVLLSGLGMVVIRRRRRR